MNDFNREMQEAVSLAAGQSDYVAPVVRVMTDDEVLSAFQVHGNSSVAWWCC